MQVTEPVLHWIKYVPYPTRADLGELLRTLTTANVEFIIIGGTAAVLHGAPTTTFDLDIVHRRTADNVQRLMDVLSSLDAIVREPTNRRLRPTADILMGPGQLLMSTTLGPLDALGQLHDGRGYDELIRRTVRMGDDSIPLLVLDLETLIEIKITTGRTKDKLVVPLLQALLKIEPKAPDSK
jgi:hypothetical protein